MSVTALKKFDEVCEFLSEAALLRSPRIFKALVIPLQIMISRFLMPDIQPEDFAQIAHEDASSAQLLVDLTNTLVRFG